MENLNLDNNDEKNENVGNSDLNKDNGGNDFKQNMESDNSMSNRNKEYEDEPPPNEYEDLEEFQI